MFIAVCWALRILDAATICIALVILAVFSTDRMRRRMSRVLAIIKRASWLGLGGAGGFRRALGQRE